MDPSTQVDGQFIERIIELASAARDSEYIIRLTDMRLDYRNRAASVLSELARVESEIGEDATPSTSVSLKQGTGFAELFSQVEKVVLLTDSIYQVLSGRELGRASSFYSISRGSLISSKAVIAFSKDRILAFAALLMVAVFVAVIGTLTKRIFN